MDPDTPTGSAFKYDAFISYSRRDKDFASNFQEALNSWSPPRELSTVPQRRLRVFRDEEDFHGPEYKTALNEALSTAAKLIVLCSPDSARSEFVAEEIRLFADKRGANHIIPVIISGIPNNEARPGDEDRLAFTSELLRHLPMPLACDYRDFDARSDRLKRGRFAGAWYKTLADLCDVDRATVDRREHLRAMKRRRTIAGTSATIGSALLGLTIWALVSRAEMRRQRNVALARQYETDARLAFDETGDGLVRSTLFAAASLGATPTPEGRIAVNRAMRLLPGPPSWRTAGTGNASKASGGHTAALAFSPDGKILASAAGLGPIQLLDAASGNVLRTLDEASIRKTRTTLAFSPDGSRLAVGCDEKTCIVDPTTGTMVVSLPLEEHGQADMVWAASFSPDGSLLATGGYGSGNVFVYDTKTWRTVQRLRHRSSTVFGVAFSPDGRILATAESGSLHLWSVRDTPPPGSSSNIERIADPPIDTRLPDGIVDLMFDPGGERIVTIGRMVTMWRITTDSGGTLTLVQETPRSGPALTALSAVPGDMCLAIGTEAGLSVRCTDEFVESLRIPVPVTAVAVRADDGAIATRDPEGRVTLWMRDADSNDPSIDVGAAVNRLLVAGDGSRAFLGLADGGLASVNTLTRAVVARLDVGSPIVDMSFDRAGRRIALAAGSTVAVVDPATMKEQYHHVARDTAQIRMARFDPSGRWLVAATDRTVTVLDARTGREQLLASHEHRVDVIAVDPDGHHLATVTVEPASGHTTPTRTHVRDIASRKEIAWRHEGGAPQDTVLWTRPLSSGDSTLVASAAAWPELSPDVPDTTGSADGAWVARRRYGSAELIDRATGRTVAEPAHGGITAIAFISNDDTQSLLTAGRDGVLRFRSLSAREQTLEACGRLRAILPEATWERHIAEMPELPGCAVPSP